MRGSKRKPSEATPLPLEPSAASPELRAWAEKLDVSRLTDETVRSIEWYLRKYRWMPWFSRGEIGFRLVSIITDQVTPPPPPGISPLDIMATVLSAWRADPDRTGRRRGPTSAEVTAVQNYQLRQAATLERFCRERGLDWRKVSHDDIAPILGDDGMIVPDPADFAE
jgi:hypothetical protein